MENIKLINSIKNGFTAAEMATSLGIHDLDLYQHINKLEGSGYALSRNYFSDGNFKYTFKANDPSNEKKINIITKPNEQDVRILCMSDLHYTSSYENNDMIHKAYDYAKRNGIKLIFLCGDILQGTFGHNEFNFLPGEDQIKRFLTDFPYDNDILIFGVGGDHDESIYHKYYVNPIDVITKTRHNIVIPNYKYASLRIKDADIVLKHIQKDTRSTGYPSVPVEAPLTYEVLIEGHHHDYEFEDNVNRININIPTTSDIHSTMNGFVDLKLKFNVNHLIKVESDFITYINGNEVKLVHNAGNIMFKDRTVDNVQEFNHRKVSNPYKPTIIEDNTQEIDKLKKDLSDTKNKLSNVIVEKETLESDKVDLIEKNKDLSTTIETLESDKERLEETIKSVKYDKNKKDSKIEELERENKRVFDSNRQLTSNNKELKDSNNELRNSNQELLKELNEYKKKLKEYENGMVTPVTTQVIEEPVVVNEELDKVVEETAKAMIIAKKQELTKEEMITFRAARIEEFKKFLKKEDKEKLRDEFLQKVEEFNEEPVKEENFNDDDFVDKMCDVMDNVSMELSGDAEKKRIKKVNRTIAKGKRVVNSQMSKQDRINELLKNKKR